MHVLSVCVCVCKGVLISVRVHMCGCVPYTYEVVCTMTYLITVVAYNAGSLTVY